MAHSHDHVDLSSGGRRVSVAIWANALLTVAQVIGGVLSGSLALIADALHNFSDMASLVIAYAARTIARRPADSRMTFGYARIEVVAALINYTTLILVGLYLVYEGAEFQTFALGIVTLIPLLVALVGSIVIVRLLHEQDVRSRPEVGCRCQTATDFGKPREARLRDEQKNFSRLKPRKGMPRQKSHSASAFLM